MAKLRVLLTGFGPFPGVAKNPSAWLAETLAGKGSPLACDLHAQVLPTEWEAVAALAPRLHESLQPHVMIHFGVSPRATSVRIERSAHNRAAARADAIGRLPAGLTISRQGADRLDTGLPVTSLAAQLRAQGIAATASRSCGRYLCNFLYYRSLEWAHRQERASLALFVHIPPGPRQGGPFSETQLVHAAQETLHFVLAFAAEHEATRLAGSTPPLARNDAGLRAEKVP
jgi:pyroglutamyl-peptidase